MPKIYRPFTNHESDEIWGRIYLKEAGTIAREKTTLSTDFRLFFLGLLPVFTLRMRVTTFAAFVLVHLTPLLMHAVSVDTR